MELLILGATGNTGRELVKQTLAQGHHVTALLRHPEKFKQKQDHLTLVQGNVLDEAAVTKALQGKNAVLSALGVGNSLIAHGLMYDSIRLLVPAMQKAKISRLVWLSAFGVGPTETQANVLQKIAFRLPLRSIYSDKEKADNYIRQSAIDWTIVAPVRLTNGELTGSYNAGEYFEMHGFPAISRADVAHFMASQIDDAAWLKKTVILK
jgi:putative NADH-flavin reductase